MRHAGAAPSDIAACFEPYRPDGWSASRALDHMNAKLDDAKLIRDPDSVLGQLPEGYTLDDTARVARDIIAAVG